MRSRKSYIWCWIEPENTGENQVVQTETITTRLALWTFPGKALDEFKQHWPAIHNSDPGLHINNTPSRRKLVIGEFESRIEGSKQNVLSKVIPIPTRFYAYTEPSALQCIPRSVNIAGCGNWLAQQHPIATASGRLSGGDSEGAIYDNSWLT